MTVSVIKETKLHIITDKGAVTVRAKNYEYDDNALAIHHITSIDEEDEVLDVLIFNMDKVVSVAITNY